MHYLDLITISDPAAVYAKFRRDHPGVKIGVSTRKDKKYMIIHPDNGHKIHFGSTLADYTRHKDEARRAKFLARARKWADAETYTPAHLSYTYLW